MRGVSNLGTVRTIKDCYWNKGRMSHFEGYEIATDKHVYKVMIDNWQNCCENWGYCICSEGSTDRFIGRVLADVRLTDTALHTKCLEDRDVDLRFANIQFVDFCFVDGDVLQIAVYNEHNGYYGHDIYVFVDDDTMLEGCL